MLDYFMTQIFNTLTSKPHKLFFLGGISNAILTMLLLLLHTQGVLYSKIPFATFHAYSLIFTVFTQFFAGFLFTMFPRFLSTAEITREKFLKPFLLLNLSALLFSLSAYFAPPLIAITSASLFISYLMIVQILWQQYRTSSVVERNDPRWILIALTGGVLSHLLFLWAFIDPIQSLVSRAAIQSGFFLYLFLLILTLSQKMIPFFTEGKVTGYKANRSPYFLHTVAGLLLIKVIFSAAALNSYGFIDGLLFIITLWEIIRWRLPVKQVEAILWVLYLSLIWIPIGFLLYTIDGFTATSSLTLGKAPLHALAIGYFITILIGFGTRIVLGHAGIKPTADRFAILLFSLIQVVATVRIAADISLNSGFSIYLEAITLSALLWLVLFLLWSKRYIKLLFN
jgi:uncharacterized protein involved in response to NO